MALATAEPHSSQASLSAFVPVELKQGLVAAARLNERSVSAELRIALREHLAGRRDLVGADS
jgi:hypothetical protein